MYSIYRLIFPDGKSYVGKTHQSVERRFQEHLKSTRKCRLTVAINQFRDDVYVETLEGDIAHWAIASHKESKWIRHFKSNDPEFGYNGTRGGHYDRYDRRNNPLKVKRTGKVSIHNQFYGNR